MRSSMTLARRIVRSLRDRLGFPRRESPITSSPTTEPLEFQEETRRDTGALERRRRGRPRGTPTRSPGSLTVSKGATLTGYIQTRKARESTRAERLREEAIIISAIQGGWRTAEAMRKHLPMDEIQRWRVIARMAQRGDIEFDWIEREWRYVPEGKLV